MRCTEMGDLEPGLTITREISVGSNLTPKYSAKGNSASNELQN
jgi:hypothetical protein